MENKQLREDGQAKHEFLMQNAADWRRTRTVPVTTRRTASVVQQMRPVITAMLNIFAK